MKQAKFRVRVMLRVFVWTSVVCFFGVLTGLITLVEIPLRLLLGWLMHGFVMFPSFLEQWPKALLPLLCLALAVWMAHRFIRWWIAVRAKSLKWRLGHTIVIAALLLSGSAAAIAMSGILHQIAWLGGQPWFETHRGASRLTIAFSNGKQLLLALDDHQAQHGRYPGSLDQLEIDPSSLQKLMWVETGSHGMKEPYLLLWPGATKAEVGADPLIVSPVIGAKSEFIAGFADGSTKRLPAAELESWLAFQNLSRAHE